VGSEEIEEIVERLHPVTAELVRALADDIATDLLLYGAAWVRLVGEGVVKGEPNRLRIATDD
jgi:hypothetical protein